MNKSTTWAFCLLILGLIIFAFASGFNPLAVITDVAAVYSGDFIQVALSLTESASLILNLSLMTVVLSFLASLINPKDVTHVDFDFFGKGPIPIYLTIIGEELFTKILFIKLIGGWINTSYAGIIVCLVFGNLIWALIHVLNYKGPILSRLLKVFPAFILGFFLGYIYLRYGFWIVLLVHYTYDAIIWSMEKKSDTSAPNLINLVYWLIIGVIAWFIFTSTGIGFWMLIPLLNSLNVANLGPWTMAILIVGAQAVFGLASNFMRFDPVKSYSENIQTPPLGALLLGYVIGMVLITVMIIGISLGLTHFFHLSSFLVAITTTGIMVLFDQPKSGSAMANLWFTDIPLTFLHVFTVLAFGFWNGLLILMIANIFALFPIIVNMLSAKS